MVVAVRVTGAFRRSVEGDVVKLVARGQVVTQAEANALSMFGALASLELSDDNPHAASIVDR